MARAPMMPHEIEKMKRENERLREQLTAEKKRNEELISLMHLRVQDVQESERLISTTYIKMFTGILMEAGTVGEARKWLGNWLKETQEVFEMDVDSLEKRKLTTDIFEKWGFRIRDVQPDEIISGNYDPELDK